MREENLYKTSVFSNKDTLSEPYLMSFITHSTRSDQKFISPHNTQSRRCVNTQ